MFGFILIIFSSVLSCPDVKLQGPFFYNLSAECEPQSEETCVDYTTPGTFAIYADGAIEASFGIDVTCSNGLPDGIKIVTNCTSKEIIAEDFQVYIQEPNNQVSELICGEPKCRRRGGRSYYYDTSLDETCVPVSPEPVCRGYNNQETAYGVFGSLGVAPFGIIVDCSANQVVKFATNCSNPEILFQESQIFILSDLNWSGHVCATSISSAAPTSSPVSFRCKPDVGLGYNQCQSKISECAKFGALKWGGKGCTKKIKKKTVRALDGGCQCKGYCGYTCAKACNADSECIWKVGGCFNRVTGEKGVPIGQCSN